MVSISLRAYLSEITDMVDQRQFDESIAHCRHILGEHPKHVDTYRLLGKAYLEEQRYGDAADILQRVLSSIPEDFISQVGMSIIREDEGNIDSAIYHMERAFETQPSNHAIQAELRRLHGIRDGIEPPRIRLTRGALARMYAHGHLYDQAIQELLAALADEPLRFDLQSLLAEMYYRADKKVDAAETCTRILEKLPYCLNANRLLTKILEESGNPEEAARYREKWAELDPYAAFVGTDHDIVDKVPDNQVSIEHYEWDPGTLYASDGERPAWAASLGVSMPDGDDDDEALPEWLEREILPPDEGGESFVDIEAPTESLSYDLSEDGTLLEDDTPRDHIQPSQVESSEQDEKDWMSEFKTEALLGQEPEDEDWLAGMESAPGEAASGGEEDDWLSSLDIPDAPPEQPASAAQEEDSAEDEWFSSLASEPDGLPIEETSPSTGPLKEDIDTASDPEWLATLGLVGQQESEPAQTDQEEEIPDFLKDAGWEPSTGSDDEAAPVDYLDQDEEDAPIEQAEIPDWIQEMAPAADAQESQEEPDAEADPEWLKSLDAAPVSKTPDWLGELGEEQQEEALEDEPEPSEEEAPPEEIAQEIEPDQADMAWLESLAAKQGIPDEELVTTPEERAEAEDLSPAPESEEEPVADTDWLNQLGQDDELETPEEPTPESEQPAEDDWLSSIGEQDEPAPETPGLEPAPSPVSEEEDAFDSSWLDSISQEAAEEAAEPTAEPPAPEQPAEDDWLSSIGEQDEPAPETPGLEPAPSPVSEEEDAFDSSWLDSISQEAAEEAAEPTAEPPAPEQPAEDDWLSSIGEQDEPAPETPGLEPAPSPVSEEEDTFDTSWLEEISQEAAEEAAEPTAEPPAPEQPAEDDWLSSIGEQDEPAPETPGLEPAPSPVSEEEDTFDTSWLEEISQEAAEEAAEPSDEPPAPVEPEQPAEDDWLSSIGEQEEAAPEAPDEEPAPSPVSEEEDTFDTSWLEEISQEAAEEAAEPTAEPPAPVEPEQPAEDDWLSSLGEDEDQPQEEDEDATIDRFLAVQNILGDAEETETSEQDELEAGPGDWLSELAEPAEGTEEAAPTPEEDDNLDTDWLRAISEEAAEEASEPEETPEAEPVSDTQEVLDWLTDLEEPASEEIQAESTDTAISDEDLDIGWLDELDDEAPAETTLEEDGEEDHLDTDWLKTISEEAAEEADQEPPAPEVQADLDWLTDPEDESPPTAEADAIQETPEPMEPAGTETVQLPEPSIDEDDWLEKLEAEEDQEQTIADTDAWLTSMEMDDTPDPAEAEPDAFEMKDTGDWLDEIGLKPEAPQPEETRQEPEPLLQDTGSLEELGEIPSPTPEPEASVQPTDFGDWQPEAVQQEPAAAPEEETPPPAPAPTDSGLDAAQEALSSGDVDQAIKEYTRLIKKGKHLPEVIDELNRALEQHPINPELWQTLGDAYMKADRMKEAFEAYSKAEEMMR